MPLFLVLSACHSEPIDASCIHIQRVDQHPFFYDHQKLLRIESKDGNVLDTLGLYSDIGMGCQSHLFDTGKTFTLIDCNGTWVEIVKETGVISNVEWKWEIDLPGQYLGVYFRGMRGEDYEFIHHEKPKMSEVYVFKDPDSF